MVTDMVMVGLAMVMVEMDLEPRKAVNMAEEKKRKIKNVTIAVKLTDMRLYCIFDIYIHMDCCYNPDIYKYMDHCHNTYNYHYTHKGNDHI
jgi:hypothetical protein